MVCWDCISRVNSWDYYVKFSVHEFTTRRLRTNAIKWRGNVVRFANPRKGSFCLRNFASGYGLVRALAHGISATALGCYPCARRSHRKSLRCERARPLRAAVRNAVSARQFYPLSIAGLCAGSREIQDGSGGATWMESQMRVPPLLSQKARPRVTLVRERMGNVDRAGQNW